MVDIINLPPLPGLPDVQLAPGIALTPALTADDPAIVRALGSPAWGVYSGASPVITADTVLDLGYAKGFTISDYPTEQGGFASYDSQEAPAEARVRFASGGSPAVREALLGSLEAIVGDLNFYSIATPDRIYTNANLIRYEYRRTAQEGGASLLIVDVVLQEVRVASAGGTTGQNTADPASANPIDGGIVQPQAPTQAQSTAALPIFASGTVPPPTLSGGS